MNADGAHACGSIHSSPRHYERDGLEGPPPVEKVEQVLRTEEEARRIVADARERAAGLRAAAGAEARAASERLAAEAAAQAAEDRDATLTAAREAAEAVASEASADVETYRREAGGRLDMVAAAIVETLKG